MYSWAMERDLAESNPTLELKRLRYATTGHHAWTLAEVEQFEARHPVGTKARLALSLLLWTGLRRSDVIRIGMQHVKDGWLKLPLHKNSERTPVTVELPIAPEAVELHRRQSGWGADLFGHRVRSAVHRSRLRTVVPRALRRSKAARVFGARPKEGGRSSRRRKRCDGPRTDGNVRLVIACRSATRHALCRPKNVG